MSALRNGATLHLKSLLRVAIEKAARVHKGEAYGLCFVDLRGEYGQHFALTLYESKPLGPHPTETAQQSARVWSRSVAIDALESIAAAVLGEDMRARVRAIHEAGLVPVVLVTEDLPLMEAFDAANEAL